VSGLREHRLELLLLRAETGGASGFWRYIAHTEIFSWSDSARRSGSGPGRLRCT
jgi:hypothetical protein